MRRIAALATAALALGVATPAALGATWSKVSGDDVSGIDQAAVTVNGGRVVAAWPSGVNTELASSIAFRGWAPTPGRPLAGAGATATAMGPFTNVSQRPGILVDASGLRVVNSGVINGQSRTYITPPLAEGANGGTPIEIAQELTGPIDAVPLRDGGIEVANMTNGEVRVYRDSAPNPDATPRLQDLLGGPAGYHPSLGQDASKRLWVAWYSNASGNIGIFMLQLDPATGAPAAGAAPIKVPQSESPANNGNHLALACAAVCRIVYGAETSPTADLRLASWSPGEGAPTEVANNENLSLGLPLTAGYRADGRLWIAWWDRGTTKPFYAAKLGNAKGAGGTVQNLGLPAGWVSSGDLESVAVGTDVVLVGTVGTAAPRGSLWTTYVQDPATIIENPRTFRNGPATITAPKRISLKNLKRGKCVNVKVSVSQPARVLVQIFSGPLSRRLFGQRIVAFPAPATKFVCVRVPFRAKTFDPRAPAGILVAVRKGNARGRSGPPAKVVTRDVRFF
ncbi:MAG TPA: hypothetical protein VL422_02915 [Miltoncostaea sp.]|nr:hypothetical protein [Miltoncostaea sp.]